MVKKKSMADARQQFFANERLSVFIIPDDNPNRYLPIMIPGLNLMCIPLDG